jgi:hypothetical protein
MLAFAGWGRAPIRCAHFSGAFPQLVFAPGREDYLGARRVALLVVERPIELDALTIAQTRSATGFPYYLGASHKSEKVVAASNVLRRDGCFGC